MDSHLQFLLLLCGVALASPESNRKLLSFFGDIQRDEEFQSIFVFDEHSAVEFSENFIRDVTTALQIPMIVSTNTTSFSIKKEYNENILTIVLLDNKKNHLQRLLEYLQHMRSSKTIFLLNNVSKDEYKLEDLFNYCWENYMINVIAIFQDFQDSPVLYRYTRIPTFIIERVNWTKGHRAFPNRLRDLKGMYLPVSFGGPEPGIIISNKTKDENAIKGYMGHFFRALARKHGARLNTSHINSKLSAYQLQEMVFNGTTEISAAASAPTTYSKSWISYPYNINDVCIMIPAEPKVPKYKIFGIVFHRDAFLITIALVLSLSILLNFATFLCNGEKVCYFNDNCLRGVLRESFVERPNASVSLKILYSLILFFGIMVGTSFDAFLQTLMTSPPPETTIKSFEDLLASQIKAVAYKGELEYFYQFQPDFKKKYEEIFLLEPDYNAYIQLRETLNTNYAYVVNTNKWNNFRSQQNLFSRPLFRLPEALCIYKGSRLAFSINENSIYKEIINFLILETHSSGLLEFWLEKSFYELIESGQMSLEDPTSKSELKPMKVVDLKWVLMAFAVALVIDTLCFLGEVYVYSKKNGRQ